MENTIQTLNAMLAESQVVVSYSTEIENTLGLFWCEGYQPISEPLLKEPFLILWTLRSAKMHCQWCYSPLKNSKNPIRCRVQSCGDLFCSYLCEEECYNNYGYVKCCLKDKNALAALTNCFTEPNCNGITIFKLYARIIADIFRGAIITQNVQESIDEAIKPIKLIKPNTAPLALQKSVDTLQTLLKNIFGHPDKLFNNLFSDQFTTYKFPCLEQLFKPEFILLVYQNVRYNAISIRKNVYGLFQFSSILNHSCKPNCYIYYKKRHLYIQLIAEIDEQDELVINYLDGERLSYEQRSKKLREVFGFQCRCERCLYQE